MELRMGKILKSLQLQELGRGYNIILYIHECHHVLPSHLGSIFCSIVKIKIMSMSIGTMDPLSSSMTPPTSGRLRGHVIIPITRVLSLSLQS